jgi:PIN domain nuclease of toxin-antitoxin system
VIVDTSALLAMIRREVGAPMVGALAPHAGVSLVTWVEIISWIRRRMPVSEPRITELELQVHPFRPAEAEAAFRPLAAHHGRLSLGDCACPASSRGART